MINWVILLQIFLKVLIHIHWYLFAFLLAGFSEYSCLNFLFFSYTELEIAVPDIGIVGLHAENLVIESVSVDGEPTEFEFYPHHQHTESEKRWSSVLSASSAADVASSMYVSALERELVPNLLIMCCKPEKSASEQQGQQSLENGLHSSGEPKQVIVIIISDAFNEFNWVISRDYTYIYIYIEAQKQTKFS